MYRPQSLSGLKAFEKHRNLDELQAIVRETNIERNNKANKLVEYKPEQLGITPYKRVNGLFRLLILISNILHIMDENRLPRIISRNT